MADEIFKEVSEIIRKVLNKKNALILPETTAKEIDGWDSFAHIQIIFALEKHFKINFTTTEIVKFKNVKGACELIKQRQNSN